MDYRSDGKSTRSYKAFFNKQKSSNSVGGVSQGSYIQMHDMDVVLH
jgi:hypothetical protein